MPAGHSGWQRRQALLPGAGVAQKRVARVALFAGRPRAPQLELAGVHGGHECVARCLALHLGQVDGGQQGGLHALLVHLLGGGRRAGGGTGSAGRAGKEKVSPAGTSAVAGRALPPAPARHHCPCPGTSKNTHLAAPDDKHALHTAVKLGAGQQLQRPLQAAADVHTLKLAGLCSRAGQAGAVGE